jgi:glycerophosphoryl diester phosphodiesterase
MIFDGKPAVIGHRGFGAGERGGYRENTMASYLAALAHGLSWVELDVQRSLDGQLVIRHDPVTQDGTFLVTQTADQLGAAGILRFHDVMAELPADVSLNIDVKTIMEDAIDPPAKRTATLVAKALRRYAGHRRMLISSFDPSALLYLKAQRLPDLPLGLIAWLNFPNWYGVTAAAGLGLDVISLHTGSFGVQREEPRAMDRTPEQVIDAAHRAGLEVLGWAPAPPDAVRLATAGADALCVNDIPGVVAALAPFRELSSSALDHRELSHSGDTHGDLVGAVRSRLLRGLRR